MKMPKLDMQLNQSISSTKICFSVSKFSTFLFYLVDCRYWNYLRKQTFVLESYTTKVNQIMNRALFFVHCYLSWGFVAPYIMSSVHVAAALASYCKGYRHGDAGFPGTGKRSARNVA